jgi:hypothetical protein
MSYSAKRQAFLVDQGYAIKAIAELARMEGLRNSDTRLLKSAVNSSRTSWYNKRLQQRSRAWMCQTFGVRSRNPISSSVVSIYLKSELTLTDTKSYRPAVL